MKKNIPAYTLLMVIYLTVFNFAQVFDWEWQNPKPTGADHNDAIVLSLTKFILTGNGGSVLISTDAGVTWSQQNIDPLARDIYSATFKDENIGYAAGTSGLLYKTTDGGETWAAQNSGVTTTLWDVDFINPDTGFVVGAGGTVLYTTDGGTNWSASNYGTTTLYKIHFIDESIGYLGSASATTGRLIKTTDGGLTWFDITASVAGLTGTVRGIHFVDTNTGWISNSTGLIFKTTDGGTTWSQVYNIGSSITIYEIKFQDLNNGYAISAAGTVLKTTDGGTSWTLTQTDATKNLYGLGLLGIQSSIATGIATPVLIGGDAGTIVMSMNDGATWELGHTATSQDLLYRASFVSESVGYSSGGTASFGNLLKTTDGGLNWNKLSLDPGQRFYSVHFLNENVGYAGSIGPTGLYKTTDGGQNWVSLNTGTGVSTSIIYDVKFFDDNLGLAMYSSGQVARTTDGGNNWTAVSAGWGSAAGYNIFFVNSSTVYICGGGGRISKSVDGGASFSQLPTLGTATLYYLHFFDANTGFIAASGGRIYKTIDGFNFTETQLPVTSIFYSIKFAGTNIGWLGGSSGNLFYTEDGGNNWTKSNLSIGSSQTIREIEISEGRMWLVGTDGMIIRGYADPLIPVELASFNASVIGNDVTLSWTTASEVNNLGFDIERQTNNEWQNIGFVEGKGTTTGITNYSFIDKDLVVANYNYRIKQIDMDGTFKYHNLSESIEVGTPDKFELSQNYPNPFNPATAIKYTLPQSGLVTLKVFNVIGQEIAELVNEVKQAGSYTIEFNANSLPSGVYIYKLNSGNFTSTKKMLLIK
jgi:photosystem II stability/assembly factor-like uncharacterized protein